MKRYELTITICNIDYDCIVDMDGGQIHQLFIGGLDFLDLLNLDGFERSIMDGIAELER